MQPGQFIIERTFKAPIEQVWEAITDKDQMRQWYKPAKSWLTVGRTMEFRGLPM